MDFLIKHLPHLCLSIFFMGASQTSAQTSGPQSVPALAKGEGLLLLDLQVEAASAVMILDKIGSASAPIEIKLLPSHNRWLLTPLPKGDYQITGIKVPYFDLPYHLDTNKKASWRIRIQAAQLNYAGRIEIARERTERHVAITRLNRLVTDLPKIADDLAAITNLYPISNGNGLRDDFAASVTNLGKKP